MLAQLALLTVTISITAAWLYPSPVYNFLDDPVTPQVVAMGGCGATMVAAESGFYNPASLGILHLEKKCSVSFPFHSTPIMARTESAYAASQVVSAGLSLRQLGLAAEHGPDVSLAIGYSRAKLDWGELGGFIIGYRGYLDTLRIEERADVYSVSLAIDYGVRLAFGYSSKKVYSDFAHYNVDDGEAKFYDIGVLATTRLRTILKRPGSPTSAKHTYVSMAPTIAFVHRNGIRKLPPKDVFYSYPGQSLIEARNVLGISVRGALDREDRVELMSFTASAEFSEETNSPASIESVGAELGLGGTLFLRTGNRSDSNYSPGYGGDIPVDDLQFLHESRNFHSYGFGIEIGGALAWAWELGWLPRPRGSLSDVFDNLQLTFDYAKMNVDDDSVPDVAQSGLKLSFSF